MHLSRAAVPYGFAWSSPFVRWQGALGEVSSLDTAVAVTTRALGDRALDPTALDQIVLGWTVPQEAIFYGAPTVAARIGAEGITGPMVSQACATSVACVHAAAGQIEAGMGGLLLIVTTDRTSNGPHLVYPRPSAPGGTPAIEDWVMDSFRRDPWAGLPMVGTAERVAAEGGFTREQVDDLTLLRYEQYRDGLADDRAFQREWMVPVEIPRRRGTLVVEADEGIHDTTAEGLGKLAPLDPDGVITHGSQTHPADGAAGMIVTTLDPARELGRDGAVVRLLGTGFARVGKGEMPKAPVPAARAALEAADVDVRDLDAVVTHNPFAVNDLWFSRETGYPVERMNVYGSSLVYGHPQGPTGARGIAELMATLYRRGGGTGLFTGCAAGDTGAALVVRMES